MLGEWGATDIIDFYKLHLNLWYNHNIIFKLFRNLTALNAGTVLFVISRIVNKLNDNNIYVDLFKT